MEANTATCIYCENPERYDLEPVKRVTLEKNKEVGYHYEKSSYLSGIPRRRIRCQKSYG